MIIKLLLYCLFSSVVVGSDIFHVLSKTTFHPNEDAMNYFGYSVLLTKNGLIVGAPKASREVNVSPGEVFTCSLDDSFGSFDRRNDTCNPLNKNSKYLARDYFDKDDSWFGATLADTPDGTLFACAPRKVLRDWEGKAQKSQAFCYVQGKKAGWSLSVSDRRLTFHGEEREDYASYYSDSKSIYKYRYQTFDTFGISIDYTKDDTVIIGAPKVMEGAGTIFQFKYHPSSFTFETLTSPNPYFTKDLTPDDYFGFSVASGIFEENGQILYVGGAPRSKKGYGQVLIIEKPVKKETEMRVKAKVTGPQLGSYFGYSVSTPDLNMDGLSDLVVGAPNYAVETDVLTYDQGAVYVFLTKKTASGFVLEEAGVVKGSGDSGARFGTSIANLGDIDNDGYTDIAIGAPWEKHNGYYGVVYIYKGTKNGLMSQYTQRIFTEANGFGISISKGYDVDKNGINDLAIGAFDSNTAYLYRSIPTIQVLTSINVQDLVYLKKSTSTFVVQLCLTIPPKKSWPKVFIRLNATISVDPDRNRAKVIGKPNDELLINKDTCYQKKIEVDTEADFSKPIFIKFDVKPLNLDDSPSFPLDRARLAEDSKLQSSVLIMIRGDCGEDLVCKPKLELDLKPLRSTYRPGVDSTAGFNVTVKNIGEPAFSIKLHMVLPYPPKRLHHSCILQDLDVTCDLPTPLKRNQTVEWEIHLEYTWTGADTELLIAAELKYPVMKNITNKTKELVIPVVPQVNYTFSGVALPNSTVYITRNAFNKKEDVFFTHYYEIANLGPPDLYNLVVEFSFSKNISLASEIEGSRFEENKLTVVPTLLRANTSTGLTLPLLLNFAQYGDQLIDLESINVTSTIRVYVPRVLGIENRTIEVTTRLVLEPPLPLWPLIVALVSGLLLLAVIILVLYKCGFFSRPKKEDLKQLIENKASQENPGNSTENGSSADSGSS